jgi:hypothetical protein
MSKLNSKTLTIAAVVLMVLALLFMATPLLRVAGVANLTGFTRPANGQFPSGGQNGFPNQGGGLQGQGNSTTPGQQFTGQPRSLLGFGFLNGMTGIIVYAIALLVSLAAAVGMFLTRRWGQVLGIVMAVIYLILALASFIPMLLMSFMSGLNGLSLGLSILNLVLAIAVIVLALIPAKKVAPPTLPATPAIPPAAIA